MAYLPSYGRRIPAVGPRRRVRLESDSGRIQGGDRVRSGRLGRSGRRLESDLGHARVSRALVGRGGYELMGQAGKAWHGPLRISVIGPISPSHTQ